MSAAILRFDNVGFTYPGADGEVLSAVDLRIDEGEFVLVIGGTGSGKSTLLRAISGLVPRFSGGVLTGRVSVAGRTTEAFAPRDLADVVGTVGQDPAATFVADTVIDEVVYVMENLAVAPDDMRRRLEDTLDLLDIADLRHRSMEELSGGQQQRVAIASVLAANPRVLVLDEPTSALDPAAADEVLSALQRLVHDVGLTVIVAEHRLERVVQFADRVLHVRGRGEPLRCGEPREVLVPPAPRPPVVRLGEVAGWDRTALTVREARRQAGDLQERLRGTLPPDRGPAGVDTSKGGGVRVEGLWAAHGPVTALRGVDLCIAQGEIVAVMGRNGAGKSTLLAHLAGLSAPVRGSVEVNGAAPHSRRPRELIRSVGLVPQDFSILLFADSVAEECTLADTDAGLAPGSTAAILDALVAGVDQRVHPRDLSEGQRLCLAMAVVLSPSPAVLCLDEPTRGLDQPAKDHLASRLRDLAAAGHTVVLASHDVELVASLAERVVVLADGEVVDDGPARRVVCRSPVFAPQVARVMAPAQWLTVDEVAAALAPVDGGAEQIP